MTTPAQKRLVQRVRSARWVDIKVGVPPPSPAETPEQELTRLREELKLIGASDRTIRSWEYVSDQTKQQKLSENAVTRMGVEARIKQLAGGKGGRQKGVHSL